MLEAIKNTPAYQWTRAHLWQIVLVLICAGLLCLVIGAALDWIAGPPATYTTPEQERQKTELQQGERVDIQQADTARTERVEHTTRAKQIRHQRKVQHETDTKAVEVVRDTPDASQRALTPALLTRAEQSLAELAEHDRQRATERAERRGDAADQ